MASRGIATSIDTMIQASKLYVTSDTSSSVSFVIRGMMTFLGGEFRVVEVPLVFLPASSVASSS